jgi:hypothetical protein
MAEATPQSNALHGCFHNEHGLLFAGVQFNTAGGNIIFLSTSCGGGHLSSSYKLARNLSYICQV